METFVKLQNPFKGNTELKIYLTYSKGGLNPFTYERQKQGVLIGFKPIKRTEFGYECSFGFGSNPKESGFTVFVKEMKRRSSKQEEKIFNSVLEMKEKLTELYEQEKYEELVNLLSIWK